MIRDDKKDYFDNLSNEYKNDKKKILERVKMYNR